MKIGKIFRKKEEQEEVMPKMKKFEVIDGGKANPQTAGKEPPTEDWLTPLGVNTVFLARTKKLFEPSLAEFTVVKHSEKSVQLRVTGNDMPIWFDPGRFCATQELFDVLHYGDTE